MVKSLISVYHFWLIINFRLHFLPLALNPSILFVLNFKYLWNHPSIFILCLSFVFVFHAFGSTKFTHSHRELIIFLSMQFIPLTMHHLQSGNHFMCCLFWRRYTKHSASNHQTSNINSSEYNSDKWITLFFFLFYGIKITIWLTHKFLQLTKINSLKEIVN